MRQRFFSPALLLALMWSLAYPQQTIPRQSGVPAQRQLTGKVYSLSPTGEKKPEPNLIVIMEQTGKGDDTNDLGIFHLDLPPAFKSGESVNLSIKKEGWRLPADGKVRIPYDLREIVEVEIVPTSAAAFFTDARFVNFIKEVAEKSTRQAPAQGGETEKVDFGRYIKEWAVQYGFSAQQAKEEIDKWIAEIEAKSNDLNRLGLAAFAKKNFGEAAKNFEAAFAQDSTQLASAKKQRQALEEKEEQLTTKAIENARLAGDSYYNDNQFEKALARYRSAQQFVDKTKFPQQWANLALVMGNANLELGIRAEGEKIQAYFSAAQQAYQQAAVVWPRDRKPEGWAAVQTSLGNLFSEQGTRTGGEEGAKLLRAAVTAFENALQVYTRAQLPQDWAMTQNNLGNVLRDLGTRTGGEEGAKLLAQAVTAYEYALQVFTRAQLPQQWATTQNNLGTVLRDLGTRTGGEEGAKWLRAAVTAYENALVVRTREHLPQDWAMTQNNLGTVLHDLGTRTGGEEGAKLLAQAVTAYENALQVRTRAQLPQQWATTQNNLGNVLCDLGTRTGGEEGAKLLAQAVTAYENALQVYTRAQLPQQWAATQNNLGTVLRDLGTRTGGEEGAKWLRAAVTAYGNALEIFTYEHISTYWATTQNNLAETYTHLEDWPNVAVCYANVLKVYPDYKQAYQTASYLYHEVLHKYPADYASAFTLNQNWLAHHPEDLSAQCDFAEKHFTTGRFAACEQRLAALLANAEVEPSTKIALRAIGIANALAQNKTQQAPAELGILQAALAAQPDTFKVGWSFEGTKHFISQNEKLAPHRAWLLQFFEAIERKEGREAILAGLKEAREKFKTK
ncbi:MAG: hypothetical protein ONB43_24935 [candidate division KSB1 bacterium]|nr:hypothetical protein [candidate division KSB1 bacterium]